MYSNSENYEERKYLKSHCPVMNAINILKYILPLVHLFWRVPKTKCSYFRKGGKKSYCFFFLWLWASWHVLANSTCWSYSVVGRFYNSMWVLFLPSSLLLLASKVSHSFLIIVWVCYPTSLDLLHFDSFWDILALKV